MGIKCKKKKILFTYGSVGTRAKLLDKQNKGLNYDVGSDLSPSLVALQQIKKYQGQYLYIAL